jgi:hypothetical protein
MRLRSIPAEDADRLRAEIGGSFLDQALGVIDVAADGQPSDAHGVDAAAIDVACSAIIANARREERHAHVQKQCWMRVFEGALPQIAFDVLIEAPAYCLTASDHPLAKQTSVRLKDLAEETMIVLNRPIAADYYQRVFSMAGHNKAKVAYANPTEMVRSLVGAGHGCALLNMLPSTEISYAGDRLVALPIQGTLPSLTLAVGYDKKNPRRMVRHFVNRCHSYFGKGAGHSHIMRS